MKRLFFLNRFYAPDHSATSQLVGDVATDLAEHGHDVHVITSRQLYNEPQARLPLHEYIKGVTVYRVTTTQFGRARLALRAIDYLSFYASAWRALRKLTKPHDIVVAMTDPPMVSLIAMQAATRRGAYLINWLQDIYPEIAVELGVPFLDGPALRIISSLRDRSLKLASANVVLGSNMADKVAARGIGRDQIHIIPNWSDDSEIVPVPASDNPLRRDWGLTNKFVVGYSGNLGRAHEFYTVVTAAEQLRDNGDIVFLCIGGGHLLKELKAHANERGLNNFRFMDYQDQASLKHSLGVPDVHWISLRPEVEGLIVPSKVYGIAAAGRPIIAVCAKNGEISKMVEEHHCGIVVEPGDGNALTTAIVNLSKDAERCALMGRRARAMLDTHFTRQQAFQRWRTLLEGIGQTY